MNLAATKGKITEEKLNKKEGIGSRLSHLLPILSAMIKYLLRVFFFLK